MGDARLQPPVVPVENHHSCRANAEGELILPNEQAWRPDTVIKIIMSRLLARADKMLDMPVRFPCPNVPFSFFQVRLDVYLQSAEVVIHRL